MLTGQVDKHQSNGPATACPRPLTKNDALKSSLPRTFLCCVPGGVSLNYKISSSRVPFHAKLKLHVGGRWGRVFCHTIQRHTPYAP